MSQGVQYYRGRVALVTGAASGIGRSLATQLHTAGARVIALDRDLAGLERLREALGNPTECLVSAFADVTDRAGLIAAIGSAAEAIGPVDFVFASAGIGRVTVSDPFDLEAIEATIDVNLLGVIRTIATVLPGMLERGQGQIVGIASMAAFGCLPGMLAYSASKAGVLRFLEGLRLETEDRGVRVTAVCPAWVRTPMTAPVRMPMPFLMEPDAAARRILRAVARGKRLVKFPRRAVALITLMRLFPRTFARRLVEPAARLARELAEGSKQ